MKQFRICRKSACAFSILIFYKILSLVRKLYFRLHLDFLRFVYYTCSLLVHEMTCVWDGLCTTLHHIKLNTQLTLRLLKIFSISYKNITGVPPFIVIYYVKSFSQQKTIYTKNDVTMHLQNMVFSENWLHANSPKNFHVFINKNFALLKGKFMHFFRPLDF